MLKVRRTIIFFCQDVRVERRKVPSAHTLIHLNSKQRPSNNFHHFFCYILLKDIGVDGKSKVWPCLQDVKVIF